MLDWLGSVYVRKRTPTRVELQLTRATSWTGWAIAAVGFGLVTLTPLWAWVVGVLLVGVGVLLGTLRRTLVFDRDDGLLRVEQRVLGIRRRSAVPLFHLRQVVVAMRHRGTYVAYVERRVGDAIHLDEARQAAPLLALADAISEVAELRRVFDATSRIAD
ncbi:MAG: hypothetical protein NT062_25555 [Proteobacteria bacterium]|nr:hypothetical protein [Pseudomonadota bacterium]